MIFEYNYKNKLFKMNVSRETLIHKKSGKV